MSNVLRLYADYGQSVWLDYIDRSLMVDGGLKLLVTQGLRGVTSNPTIFHKAITASSAYDDTILDLLQSDPDISAETLYEWLTIQDVQMAADVLAPVYESSEGRDGFVSLEVSPHLAYRPDATIQAAQHLWRAVGRPNLMIKVPATVAGLSAIEALIMDGVNVNATLLFSVNRYKAVADAYLRGVSRNPMPERVASVASFFVSRVDTKVDAALDDIGSAEARGLKGKIAIANAKMAYQHFRSMVDGRSFQALRARGARPQRPLWASTGTKNPEYSDVLYVEQLIGADTVNTLPPATLDALQAHGELRTTLDLDVDAAQRTLAELDSLGVNLNEITGQLEQEGVRKFAESYDQLLVALEDKRFQVAKRFAQQRA